MTIKLDSSWDKHPEIRDLLLRAVTAAAAGDVPTEEHALHEAARRVNKTWFGSLPRRFNEEIDRLTAAGAIRRGAHFLGHLHGGGAGPTQFWDDRIVTGDGTVRLVDENASAKVDTAGNISYAFGYDGIGGISIGSTARYDDRELYLLIEHPEWQLVAAMNPEHGKQIRELATALNQAARRLSLQRANEPEPQAGDIVSRLRELTGLHEAGALTTEEFTAAKARILAERSP